MKTVFLGTTAFLMLVVQVTLGQNHTDIIDASSTSHFETLVEQIETHFASHGTGKYTGYKQFKRWERFNLQRLDANDKIVNISAQNLKEWAAWKGNTVNGLSEGQWIENPYSTTAPSTAKNRGTGRVGAIAMDPDGNLFIGSAGGGIWKRKVNTTTWEPLSDGLPSIGVSSIVINPNLNPQGYYDIYILTGDGNVGTLSCSGIFRSSDGGQTWNSTSLSFPLSLSVRGVKLLMNPQTPLTQFAATTNGIYKTTNGWVSSQLVEVGFFTDLEFKPGNTNVIYAAEIPSSFYGTTNARLWKSVNGGANFGQVTGLNASLSSYRIEIATTPAAPDNVYILQGGHWSGTHFDFYLSTNNAASFVLEKQISPSVGYQSTRDLELAVSPTNPADVHVGSLEVWHSENVGSGSDFVKIQNIHNVTTSYMHVDIAAIEILDGRILCGHDGGIHELTNLNPVTWTSLSDGLRILQVYDLSVDVSDPNRYAVGTQDNGSNTLDASGVLTQFASGDGDRVIIDRLNPQKISYGIWSGAINPMFQENVTSGSPYFLNYVFAPTPQNVFVADHLKGAGAAHKSPLIFSEADNTVVYGNTKFGDIIRADFSPIFYPDPINQPNLFGASSYSNLTNGQIYQPQLGGPDYTPCTHIVVAKSDEDYVYAVKSNRAVWVTKNGGTTWTQIYQTFKKSHNISDIIVSPTDPEKVWLSFGGYDASLKVRTSLDAGATWQDVSTGLPNLPANCLVYQEASNDQIYVGMDVGVYILNDNSGLIWSPFMNGLPNTIVTDLEINYNDYTINAGTYGRGIWQSHLACTDQLVFSQGHVHSLPENHEAQVIESQASNNTGSDVKYRGAQDVVLKENFVSDATYGEFKAFIEPCGDPTYKREQVKPITGTYAGPLKGMDQTTLTEAPVEEGFAFNAYPNPAKGVLNLAISSSVSGTATFRILNAMGQEVLSHSGMDVQAGYHTQSINTESLANGTYILIVQSGNWIETQQILISH